MFFSLFWVFDKLLQNTNKLFVVEQFYGKKGRKKNRGVQFMNKTKLKSLLYKPVNKDKWNR